MDAGKLTYGFNQPFLCEILVRGQLHPRWLAWFQGMQAENTTSGSTRLTGVLADQAALYGVLAQIRDLGLELISLQQLENQEEE